jgi:hypothetical protein
VLRGVCAPRLDLTQRNRRKKQPDRHVATAATVRDTRSGKPRRIATVLFFLSHSLRALSLCAGAPAA